MQRLSWRVLLAVAVVTAVAAGGGWLTLDRAGATPLRVPWTTGAVCLVVAAVTWWQGRVVRQYLAGKRPGLDPFRAARTVVLAQASAYGGAVLAGLLGGYAVALAAHWSHAPRREVAILAAVSALCAVVLWVVGVVVERWCRVDPPQGDGTQAAGGTLAT